MNLKMHTYDEWNEKGFFVRKGEKATFKKGKHLFFENQVEKKGKTPYSSPVKEKHNYADYRPSNAVPELIAEGDWRKKFDASLDVDEQMEYFRVTGSTDITEEDLPF